MGVAIVVPDEVEVRTTNLFKEISTMTATTMVVAAANPADRRVRRYRLDTQKSPLA